MTEMALHVLCSVDGRLQGTLITGDHVSRGKAVDQAGDGIQVLHPILFVAFGAEVGAEVLEVDGFPFFHGELGFQIEVQQLLDLMNPPVLLLNS